MSGYRRRAGTPPIVVVWGVTRAEVFETAGFAFFAEGHELSGVAPTYSRPIVAPGDTYEELLANWLDELVYVALHERLVWSYFVVDRLEEGGVQGSAAGLPVGEVERTGRRAVGLTQPPSAFVEIPDGWWVELRLELEP